MGPSFESVSGIRFKGARALKVFALVATALAMAGCSLFAAQKPPDPATTTVKPAEASAAQSHRTTPATKTVVQTRTIEVVLPPEAPAAPAPVNPIPAPRPVEEGSAGGALTQGGLSRERERGAAALFTPGRLGATLLALPARAIALAPAMLGQLTINGQTVGGVPAGSTVRVKDETTTTSTDAGVDARATASGTGAGLTTNSATGAAGFDTTAPTAALPAMPGAAKGAATGGASGGDAEASVTWKGLTIPGTGMNLFQVLGVILLLGAVGVFVAGRGFPGVGLLTGPLAGVLAAVGGAALALGFLLESPWWVKALVIGVPVAGGVLYLVPRVRTIARKLDNDGKTIDELNKVVNATVVGIEEGDATGAVKKAVHVASAGWRDDVDRVVQRVLRESGFGYGAASDAAKKS